MAPQPDVIRHIAVITTAFALGQILGPLLASAWFALTASFSGILLITSSLLAASSLSLLRSACQPVPATAETQQRS